MSKHRNLKTPARSIAIRPLRPADLDAVVALEIACFPPAERFSRGQYAHLLRRALPAGTTCGLVAIDKTGAALAMAVFLLRHGSNLARLYSIAVAPAARGQGLARRLIERAARALRRRGIRRLSLEVREDNAAARRLYERLGFHAIDRLDDYYSDGVPGIRYLADIS